MKHPIRILYIDDYPLDRELVRDSLEKEHGGFELIEATSRANFESSLAKGDFDLVLSDFNILGFEGLQVLEAVQEKDPDLPVIIVTGTGSEQVAAEAIKRGASDYVIKSPKQIQLLPHIIHDTLDKKKLEIEKRNAEESFLKTHELLTNLARLVPGVIYQYRLYPDGHSAFPYSSPGMVDIYEWPPEAVSEDASPVFERLHPDDYEMVSKAIFESARTLEEFYCEFRVILPKQGLRWRWSQAHPMRMPDGGTLWHGIILDITDRKLMEEKLEQERILLRTLIDNLPDRIYVMDSQARKTLANIADLRSTGFKKMEDIIGKTDLDVFPPDLAKIYWERDRSVIDSGKPLINFEEPGLDAQGNPSWLLTSKLPLRDMHGYVIGLVGIGRDITERKLAEAELQESEQRFHSLYNTMVEGVSLHELVYDDSGRAVDYRILDTNLAFEHITGIVRDRAVGALASQLYGTGKPPYIEIYTHVAETLAPTQFESTFDPLQKIFQISVFAPTKGRFATVFQDITERKHAEEALRLSETRFRTLFEHAPVGVALIETKTGRYLDINPKYCEFIGYTRDEAQKMSFQKVSHPGELQENLDKNQALLEGKVREFSLEKRFICKDGSIKWGFLTASPLWGKDETPARFIHIAVVQDITERKEAEKLQKTLYGIAQAADQAQSLNSLYPAIHSSIQEAMPADNFYIALYDEKNDLISFPFAIGEEDVEEQSRKPGRGLTEYVLRTAKPALIDEAVEKELLEHGEIERVGRPSPIWLGVPLLVAGKSIGVMVVQDYKNPRAYGDREKQILEFVSSQVAIAIERKLAEETLRESEERFRSLFTNMINGFAYCKMLFDGETAQDFIYLDVNKAFETLTGLKNVIGKKVSDVIPGFREADREILEMYGRVVQTGKPETHETYVNALKMWFSVSVYSPHKGYFVAVFDVITDRKQAEEKLLASETRYRRLFEAARDGILILNYETGHVVDVNPFLIEMLGVPKQEILGKELWELGFFKDIAANKNNYLELIEKEYIRYEDLPMIKKDGRKFYVEFVSNVYPVNDQKVVQCNIRDITARKSAEDEIKKLNTTLEKRVEERTSELRETQEKLVRQERLAVLGQLAGGVAHELRNPLGVISNSIYYLNLIQPEANEKIKNYHSMIEQEVHTAEKIISGLLGFSRNVAADLEPVSIPEIVRGVLQRYPVPEPVRLELIFPPTLPLITADPHHMDTVLGNLIVNAYQAMVLPKTGSSTDIPAEGTLTVSARRNKDTVEIAVKDTGVGISPENMKRLFEPLFTTKLKGIGLGLALSKRLVEANNGRIEVESKVGKGSTFTLIFPVHTD